MIKFDYQWALDKIKAGASPEEIHAEAKKELIKEGKTRLRQDLVSYLGNCPIWHSTEHLSDDDVLEVFVSLAKEIIAKGRHRHG